jgi:hypothetical protein
MSDDGEVMRRLHAADPAALVDVDLDTVRALIVRDEQVPSSGTPGASADVVPIGRARRRFGVRLVAAAAAAAVLAGGGYALGSRPSVVVADRAPLPASDGVAGAAAPSAPQADASEGAFGAEPSVPTRHVASGLSTEAGTGTVYRLLPATLDEDEVRRWAQAWGVPGVLSALPEGWEVTSGTATLVMSEEHGVVSVDLIDPAADDLRDRADALLSSVGVDVDALAAGTADDGTSVLRPVVDGQEIPLGWQVSASHLSGLYAGGVEPVGSYASVSPAGAVARLDDTAFLGWQATMVDEDGTLVSGSSAAGPVPSVPSPSPVRAGGPVPWTVTTIDVVGAWRGLAWDPSTGLLVPAYAMRDASGGVQLVPALADDALSIGG